MVFVTAAVYISALAVFSLSTKATESAVSSSVVDDAVIGPINSIMTKLQNPDKTNPTNILKPNKSKMIPYLI